MLALLTVDGVLSAVLAAFFFGWRIGSVPFPISALLSGLMNAALVWTASRWTSVPRVAAMPLWAWLLTALLMTFGGPGGDILYGGVGLLRYGPVLLLALGAGPPAWMLWWRSSRSAD